MGCLKCHQGSARVIPAHTVDGLRMRAKQRFELAFGNACGQPNTRATAIAVVLGNHQPFVLPQRIVFGQQHFKAIDTEIALRTGLAASGQTIRKRREQ